MKTNLDDQQLYSRRTCLLLHGVNEEKKEDVEKKMMNVLENNLQAGLSINKISRTHRLGKIKDDGKPRPIIIRFLSYRQRKKVFDLKKNLKGQKILITENLTTKQYTLLQKCIEEFRIKEVWSIDGRLNCNTKNGRKVFTTVDKLSDFLRDKCALIIYFTYILYFLRLF